MIKKISKLLFFLSKAQVHQPRFWLIDIFFHCISLFQDSLQNQTHTAKISFWFLENQGLTIDSIYGSLLLSRAPQDSMDTTILSR